MLLSLGHWLFYLMASLIVLNFLIKGFSAHHADNAAIQGLAAAWHA